ncbi:MAG: hypothetical protein IJR90_08060 [Clostridia bacterium]|nr:hypothetical protein [Clostridia bacterium]
MEFKLTKNPGKPGRVSVPTKRTINLAVQSKKKTNLTGSLLAALIIVAVGVLVGKFGIIDRLVAASEAEAAMNAVQRQVDAGYEKIDSYGELTETYAHYTYSGMTQEELQKINRVQVIEMVRRVVVPQAEVYGFEIKGNVLTLTVVDKNLAEVNQISQELMKEEMVDYCTVKEAATNDDQRKGQRILVEDDTISAVITVYLIGEMEVLFDQ